jgi:histone acetyltransferase (RNA polymerase elongator complex component)
MSAADARADLARLIRRAQDIAAACRSEGPDDDSCMACDGSLSVAMAQATVYAEQYAAEAIEKALAPYRLRAATAEHSPKGGRAT